MSQDLVLGDKCRLHVLADHVPGLHTWVAGEEGREAPGPCRIEEAVRSTLRDRGHLGDGDGGEIEHEGKGLAMEVATRDHFTRLREDDRVVDDRSHLPGKHVLHVIQCVGHRPVNLWGAAERIGVLHRMVEIVLVAGPDRAAIDEGCDTPGRGDLARMWPETVHVLPEGPGTPHHRLDGHGTSSVGRDQQLACLIE